MKLQKRAVRIVFHKKYNDHCDPLFHDLGILPVNLLLEFEVLKFMHKLKCYNKPEFFVGTWNYNYLLHRPYNFRNDDDFQVQQVRKQSYLKHPLFFFPWFWNRLDISVRENIERSKFINALSRLYFGKFVLNFCSKATCKVCRLLN